VLQWELGREVGQGQRKLDNDVVIKTSFFFSLSFTNNQNKVCYPVDLVYWGTRSFILITNVGYDIY